MKALITVLLAFLGVANAELGAAQQGGNFSARSQRFRFDNNGALFDMIRRSFAPCGALGFGARLPSDKINRWAGMPTLPGPQACKSGAADDGMLGIVKVGGDRLTGGLRLPAFLGTGRTA